MIKVILRECIWRLLVDSSKVKFIRNLNTYRNTDTYVYVLLFVVLVKPGIPEDVELHELANDVSPFWKKLGRELKVKNPKLSQLDVDHQQDSYEKAFQMLLHWRQTKDNQATYQMLYSALTSTVVGRNDLGKKYCCLSWFKQEFTKM